MKAATNRPFIAITCFNRPQLLNTLLDSIALAQEANLWQIRIKIEPSSQQDKIQGIIRDHTHRLNIRAHLNMEKRGVRNNPHDCVTWCFEDGATHVLLLEDDLLIDPQALRWAQAIARKHLLGDNVMCANLLMTTCNSEGIFCPHPSEWDALSSAVIKTRNFSSIGLLLSQRQWEQHFKEGWFIDQPIMSNWAGTNLVGWDVAMHRHLLTQDHLYCLQSLVPRVTHIGENGTHATKAFQHRSFANVQINQSAEQAFRRPTLLDPIDDLNKIASPSARMYINLNRHLWTLQKRHLALCHADPDKANPNTSKVKEILRTSIGSHTYAVTRAKRKTSQ